MADPSGMDFIELKQLADRYYPNLPFHEAYFQLLHDAFVKLPDEISPIIRPLMGQIMRLSPKFAAAYGALYGNPALALGATGLEIGQEAWNATSKPAQSFMADRLSQAVSQSASAASEYTNGINPPLEGVKRTIASSERAAGSGSGIHVMQNSLVDHINYYGRWMQTVSAIQIAQGYAIIQQLSNISEHLGDANTIAVSGSGGPDGFARHVYDFIEQKIHNSTGDNHRFFLYHPDTNWYGAFNRLTRQNPLPPAFCAKSKNLDLIVRYMEDVRAQLNRDSEQGNNTVIHLLIPSWCRIPIKEPLHFPNSLQPFIIEGEEHKGKPLVELNLPAAPPGLLDGVANILDPNHRCKIAYGVALGITMPTVGWGVNGSCLAFGMGLGTVTGLGPLLAIPFWFATSQSVMPPVAEMIANPIYDAIAEENPRILGSNHRLNRRKQGGFE